MRNVFAGTALNDARIASGIFFGAWVWILLLALLALALSAWVKWKPAAGALMFGVFFVAGGEKDVDGRVRPGHDDGTHHRPLPSNRTHSHPYQSSQFR